MTKLIQPNMAGGEVSPSVAARPDIDKYANSLLACENYFVLSQGGVTNRPGLQFVAEVKDSTKAVFLQPFEFNTQQTYALEFGDQYLRFHTLGGLVLDSSYTKTVTGATQADPVVVTTSSAHGLSAGDEVFISGVSGMTQLNGRQLLVGSVPSSTEIALQDKGGNDVDGTGYDAYTSGGALDVPYEISTPYVEADLFELAFVQSADVLTITHPSYRPRELSRLANDSWTLDLIEFQPQQDYPIGLSATANSTGSTTFRYTVTAIDGETGEESLRALSSGTAISNITQADPAVVTLSFAVTLVTGDEVEINGVNGMTELNGRRFQVFRLSSTEFELEDLTGDGIDSTNFNAYTSGGSLSSALTGITDSLDAGWDNTVTWNRVASAQEYTVYREENGIFGFIGRTKQTSFNDANIDPDISDTPPSTRDPFRNEGNYPSTCGFYQQRRVFANTDSRTQTLWFTQTANFNNLSVSTPARDDDAIVATIASRQANEIRSLAPLRDLIVLTSGAEWVITGADGIITPSGIELEPQTYYGATALPPIVSGDTVLYMQPGQIVRDLGYQFENDAYAGNDISILARHLLEQNRVEDWTFAVAPYSIIWMARNDGVMLGLTYLREQNIFAWHRHVTRGDVESVAAIRESADDRLYTLTKRIVNGRTVRFVERMASRSIDDIQDGLFLDASITIDNPVEISDVSSTDPVVITTATAHGLSDGDVVDLSGIKVKDNTVNQGFRLDETINGTGYTVANATATTFELEIEGDAVSGSDFGPYIKGGEARRAGTEVGGLWHLEGETVEALANGYVVRNLTVSNGTVTLPEAASRVHVGWDYTAEIETLNLDAGAGETIQGRAKKISRLTVQVEDTLGMWVGQSRDRIREQKFDLPALWGQPPEMYSGNVDTTLPPDWNKEGRFIVQQRDPLPSTLLSLIPDAVVGGN